MGIIIVLLIVIIIGYIVTKMACSDIAEPLGVITITFGTLILIICSILIFTVKYQKTKTEKVAYTHNKTRVENATSNPSLTARERESIIATITRINIAIDECKALRDSFWIGAFYPHNVGNFEKFDINKIPYAKNNVEIITNGELK